MKTKSDKRVNRLVRALNRQLEHDVFGNRFFVSQVKKKGCADCHDYHYYLYRFIDTEHPERNFEQWLSESEILISKKLHFLMNSFVISSDFWETFDKDSYFKDKTMCLKCQEYKPYRIKKSRVEVIDYKTHQTKEIIGERAYCKSCGSEVTNMTGEIMRRNRRKAGFDQ